MEAGVARKSLHVADVVVKLDLERLSRQGYLTPASSAGVLAEQYRALKRRLLKKAVGNGVIECSAVNPVVVTSALPKEGKSFTAFNLAMSLAMERDISVLLVDADLSKRSLTALAQLEGASGLGDLLVNEELNPDALVLQTNVSKLRFLPAGQVQSDLTELLASERMRRLMQLMGEGRPDQLVVMDSAPVLRSSQGMALCDRAGQILFVVEEGKTPQHALEAAISQFDKDSSVGLVFNKASRFQTSGYSGYYGAY